MSLRAEGEAISPPNPSVILRLDRRIQLDMAPYWIPAFAGMTIVKRA